MPVCSQFSLHFTITSTYKHIYVQNSTFLEMKCDLDLRPSCLFISVNKMHLYIVVLVISNQLNCCVFTIKIIHRVYVIDFIFFVWKVLQAIYSALKIWKNHAFVLNMGNVFHAHFQLCICPFVIRKWFAWHDCWMLKRLGILFPVMSVSLKYWERKKSDSSWFFLFLFVCLCELVLEPKMQKIYQ